MAPKDRNLAEVSPKKFAEELTKCLNRVISEREKKARVQMSFRLLDDQADSSTASEATSSAHKMIDSAHHKGGRNRVTALFAHLAAKEHTPGAELDEIDSSCILDDHISKWDSSAKQTPHMLTSPGRFSPRARSPGSTAFHQRSAAASLPLPASTATPPVYYPQHMGAQPTIATIPSASKHHKGKRRYHHQSSSTASHQNYDSGMGDSYVSADTSLAPPPPPHRASSLGAPAHLSRSSGASKNDAAGHVPSAPLHHSTNHLDQANTSSQNASYYANTTTSTSTQQHNGNLHRSRSSQNHPTNNNPQSYHHHNHHHHNHPTASQSSSGAPLISVPGVPNASRERVVEWMLQNEKIDSQQHHSGSTVPTTVDSERSSSHHRRSAAAPSGGAKSSSSSKRRDEIERVLVESAHKHRSASSGPRSSQPHPPPTYNNPENHYQNYSSMQHHYGGAYGDAYHDKESYVVVGYYFCGEKIPYRTQVPGRQVTLRQFKQLITCPGNYKFFFKRASNEFGSEVVHEEIADDECILPLWDGKVHGKVEKLE